ncbi:alpha/beta fold hydrolase [candidate division KSB1 bacterium]|nr:alpha/beta fold hydrolase [candidate division KSB1 bacterium]
MLIRIVIYIIAGYLILCMLFYFGQNRLLYFPDTNRPDASEIHALGLEFWPNSDASFRGYLFNLEDESHRGTIIIFHGNAGAAWNRDYYCKPLSTLGYQVLLAEYPGYGGRPGKPSENVLVNDARETIRLVREHYYSDPVFVIGESLGAGVVASALADSSLTVDGICLITPWARLTELARSIYPFIPAHLLAQDKYDSIKNLTGYSERIAVAVAENDEVVTTEQGLKLFDSLKADKKLWLMDGTSHNTWMYRVDPLFWEKVIEFIAHSD